jgi:hypothetical protein
LGFVDDNLKVRVRWFLTGNKEGRLERWSRGRQTDEGGGEVLREQRRPRVVGGGKKRKRKRETACPVPRFASKRMIWAKTRHKVCGVPYFLTRSWLRTQCT